MEPERRQVKDPATRLQRLTTLALAAIGCLSIGSYVLYQRALRETQNDAPTISVAGRQRMLTQKLAQLALETQVAAERRQFAFLNADLRAALQAWEDSHVGLQQGDASLGLAPNTNPAVAQEFARIEQDHRAIAEATDYLMHQT